MIFQSLASHSDWLGGTAAVLATADAEFSVTVADLAATLAAAEAVLRPRWVVWDEATTRALVVSGARLATCWHLAAVHRLLAGGWRAEPARLWAWRTLCSLFLP